MDPRKQITWILDPQIFVYQKFGGISRYYTEVYRGLKQHAELNMVCPIAYTENLHAQEYGLFQNRWNISVPRLSSRSYTIGQWLRKRLNIRTWKMARRILLRQQFELFIPTYYDTYFLEDIGTKPFVLTVYDMIHELFPDSFPADDKTAANKLKLMEKATRILAISNSTKQDILRLYPHIDAKKIEVLYLGYTIDRNSPIKLPLPEKYILFIGNRKGYKNFKFFVEALIPLLAADPSLHLVCAGGGAFTPEENSWIDLLGIKKQLIQQNFKDAELPAYYRQAACFVFPSAYEGFGIPVLEAMACDCPVVLAHHSSFPEVAGDAGIYFELNDPIDLKNKVQQLLQDESYRATFLKKGREQAGKFSWKKCADEFYQLALNTVQEYPVK